jgi:hypothetical protein
MVSQNLPILNTNWPREDIIIPPNLPPISLFNTLTSVDRLFAANNLQTNLSFNITFSTVTFYSHNALFYVVYLDNAISYNLQNHCNFTSTIFSNNSCPNCLLSYGIVEPSILTGTGNALSFIEEQIVPFDLSIEGHISLVIYNSSFSNTSIGISSIQYQYVGSNPNLIVVDSTFYGSHQRPYMFYVNPYQAIGSLVQTFPVAINVTQSNFTQSRGFLYSNYSSLFVQMSNLSFFHLPHNHVLIMDNCISSLFT